MPISDPALAAFYTEWELYQGGLIKALKPLTPDQLAARVTPTLRSIGLIATHIIVARALWFHVVAREGSNEYDAIDPNQPILTAAELISGLESTWRLIGDSLNRWTVADLQEKVTTNFSGETETFARYWIVWHVIEHDLHHGGELSLSLGIHGLTAPDV